jgi:hypothetical protein
VTSLVAENYAARTDFRQDLAHDAAIVSRTRTGGVLAGWDYIRWGSGPGPRHRWIYGETPFNNDPVPGEGWDELNITEHTWVLNLTGPIITYSNGDAYPWNAGPILGEASGPTRRYNYDLDYMSFPPPCFPVPINVWKDVSWTEIYDARDPLTSHLPN